MIVSSDGEGKIKFWDFNFWGGAGCNREQQPEWRPRQLISISDGSLLASAGEDNLVTIWDVSTKQEVQRFVGHSNDVKCVRFSPERFQISHW